MKLLILGGTIFVGRHLVEAALARGHQVTLFNRGQHNPDLYPQVEKLRGDRDGNLTALEGRRWDAVIDTCGYVPRIVRASAELLAGAVDHYTFISSISVFPTEGVQHIDENTPVATIEDESVEEITGETYGPLKALCEQAAAAAMPGRVLNIRPGLIVGPHDPTDRFTYWPQRVARGGDVLAPGHPDAPVQFIDARDLAEWTVDMVQTKQTGLYNATGPAEPLTMGDFLRACKTTLNSDANFIWAGEAFLLEQQVTPFVEMPLWVPEDAGVLLATDCRKAIAAGLIFRPIDETIRDTLAWDQTRPADREWRAGLSPQRERELLAKMR